MVKFWFMECIICIILFVQKYVPPPTTKKNLYLSIKYILHFLIYMLEESNTGKDLAVPADTSVLGNYLFFSLKEEIKLRSHY
jgi:hypothetical protein